MIAMLIEDTLRAEGAVVAGMAATVAEARAMIEAAASRAERLDAAVVDLNLNGEPALPILVLLRAHGIPHVVATGYGETPDVGDAPVLHKPFDEEALLRALRPLLAERHAAG